jgi:hypothetical protein
MALVFIPSLAHSSRVTEVYCEKVKAEAIQSQPNFPIIKDASTALMANMAEYKSGICDIRQRYLINSSLVAAVVVRESRKNGQAITEKMVREYFTTDKARDETKSKLRSKVQHEMREALSIPDVRIAVEVEVVGPMESFDMVIESNK